MDLNQFFLLIFLSIFASEMATGKHSFRDDFAINNRFWVTRVKSTNSNEVFNLAKRNGFRFYKKVSDGLLCPFGVNHLCYKLITQMR